MPLVFGRSILGFAVVADDGVTWTTPVIDKTGYDGASINIQTQESAPQDLFFKPDGTKVYITGQSGDDVNEYNLSTAWIPPSALSFPSKNGGCTSSMIELILHGYFQLNS